MMKLYIRKLFCTSIFVFFVVLLGAQGICTKIDSIISLVTVQSYNMHFDSIRAGESNCRMVIEGEQQSTDHDACRDYIYRQFVQYFGEENVYIQHFEKGNYKGLSNVVAFKQGRNKNAGMVIVGAHYDSYNFYADISENGNAPGANDNGTGIAAVLEIARVVSGADTEASVLFAAWDFEEKFINGFPVGSNAWYTEYVKQWRRTNFNKIGRGGHINRRFIKAYLNFDMFGNPITKIDGKPVLWVCYALKIHEGFAGRYSETVNNYVPEIKAIPYGRMPYSDHLTFAMRRIPAVENLQSDYLHDPFYHSSLDNINNPDNIDMRFAKRVTRGGLAFLLEKLVLIN